MGFEKEIKEQVAIASKRICCICKNFVEGIWNFII